MKKIIICVTAIWFMAFMSLYAQEQNSSRGGTSIEVPPPPAGQVPPPPAGQKQKSK